MSDPKHRSSSTPPTKTASGTAQTKSSTSSNKAADVARAANDADNKQSGRVAFDSRGNPIWEWQTSTGVFDKNVSTQRLKKLESPELTLADTQPVPVMPKHKGLEIEDSKRKAGAGFNPYNSGTPAPRSTRPVKQAAHPALVHKSSPPPRPVKRAEPEKPETTTWQKLKSKFTDD